MVPDPFPEVLLKFDVGTTLEIYSEEHRYCSLLAHHRQEKMQLSIKGRVIGHDHIHHHATEQLSADIAFDGHAWRHSLYGGGTGDQGDGNGGLFPSGQGDAHR